MFCKSTLLSLASLVAVVLADVSVSPAFYLSTPIDIHRVLDYMAHRNGCDDCRLPVQRYLAR